MLPSFFGRYEGLTGLYDVTSVFGGGLSLPERIATPIFSKTRKLAILWGVKLEQPQVSDIWGLYRCFGVALRISQAFYVAVVL